MFTQTKRVNFQDTKTRVRINPETYLKFENSDVVSLNNIASEKSIQIKYDIMLILYPMVNQWITVGDLCEGWPPEDQEKIKSHLEMLYEAKVIITQESEMQQGKSENNLPKALGSNITINIENHHHMLRDSVRMAAYQRAIEKLVNEDSVVLDLGAGSGILSFFAARAGAKKVYAVEKRPDMIQVAKELARTNGFEDRIEFIENSSHLIKAEELDPKPTVLVSEILGNAILEENVLEFTLDARERFLAPEGKLIPGALEIMIVAFDAGPLPDKAIEVEELERIYGFNLDLMKTILSQKPSIRMERFNPQLVDMMSDPISAITLDFSEMTSSRFSKTVTFSPLKDGFINGFCAYFRASLDTPEPILTNSPWAPQTHWTQVVFSYPTRRPVKAKEKITVEMTYDGNLNLWIKE